MDKKAKSPVAIVPLFISLGFTIVDIYGLVYSQEFWRSVCYAFSLLIFGSFVCINLIILYKLKKSH